MHPWTGSMAQAVECLSPTRKKEERKKERKKRKGGRKAGRKKRQVM
jgi:hypothetical protein